jgi:hypothetical protein
MSGSGREVGGLDYNLLKRQFDNDDYAPDIPFTATQDYYTIGTMAYISNPTLYSPIMGSVTGWILFKHGQAAAPAWFSSISGTPAVWPSPSPAFEAKDIMFYATTDCYVRFGGATNVQHLIPALTYVRFHRRCLIFFFQQKSAPGTLRVWIEG